MTDVRPAAPEAAAPTIPRDDVAARLRGAAVRILTAPALRDAVLPTAGVRVVVLVLAPILLAVFRPDALPHGDLLQIWNRWDAPHFLEIAQLGYGPPAHPARIALFPLFPGLIALGSLIVQPLMAGMIVSFIATLAAAVGLYELVRIDHDRPTARAAVIAMNAFPTAYAFVAPYSEAPFLAFTVWALYASRRHDWRAAGILAMLAGLTRLQGAFLVPALALEYLVVRRRLGWDVAWVGVGLLGPLVYLAINFMTFHDPFFFMGIQDTIFHVKNVLPWDTLPGLIHAVFQGTPSEYWTTVYLAPLAAFVLLGLATVWTVVSRRSRPVDAAFTALNFFSLITLNWPISVPRYLLGIAPVFTWLGTLMRRPAFGQPLLLGSTILMGMFMTLFVEGHWAF